MKTITKVMCCILAAVIFFYLIIWDYGKLKKQLDPMAVNKTGIEQLDPKNDGESENIDQETAEEETDNLTTKVQSIDEQIQKLEEQQKESGTAVHLYFDQVFESAYEQLYPLLKENGYTGTLVLTDGQLPGDNLQMTEDQFLEMLENGWELAVGGSEDIDMTGDIQSVAVQWTSYLKDYLADIKTRLNIVPTTYCFNKGEYREEFDQILKKLGFTKIRYFGEESLKKTDGFTKIRGYQVSQSSNVEKVIEDLDNYSEVALSTRRVAERIDGDSQNIEISKFKTLLTKIGDSEKIYIAGSKEEKDFLKEKESLEKQIAELKKQKEEIDKQLDKEEN